MSTKKNVLGGASILAVLLVPCLLIGALGVMVILAASIGGAQSSQMESNDSLNGGKSCASTTSAQTGAQNSGVSDDEKVNNNVRTIIGIGKGLGISETGIKVALVTAIKESGIRNLANDGVHGSEDDGGEWPAAGADHYLNLAKQSMNLANDGSGTDHDSVGMYQQRLAYWWTGDANDPKMVSSMMDPTYQATVFYLGTDGNGGLKGKTDVWNAQGNLSGDQINTAVQKVQGAAAGTVNEAQKFWDQANAYYNANADAPPMAASAILTLNGAHAGFGGGGQPSQGASGPALRANCQGKGGAGGGSSYTGNATGTAKKILDNAFAQDGYRYPWGGGDVNGPTDGGSLAMWPGVTGFDCSGLVLYSVYKATDGQISLPHQSGAQESFYKERGWIYADGGGESVPPQAQPGDIVFFGGSHVAIYAGNNQYFQASWNYGEAEKDKDIGLGAVGRHWTSWGRTGGM